MIVLNKLTYKSLFDNLSFNIDDNARLALIGKNGIGKSTIFRLINGDLIPDSGYIKISPHLHLAYLAQDINRISFNTIADVFGLEKECIALNKIESGISELKDYEIIDGHWNCMDVIYDRLRLFDLDIDPMRYFNSLSGGEKIKVLLARMLKLDTNFLLLDEPTNNLDYEGKEIFYNFISKWKGGVFVISHDRELLNIVDNILELQRLQNNSTRLISYGGNYDCYRRIYDSAKETLDQRLNTTINKFKIQSSQILEQQKKASQGCKNHSKALNKRKLDKTTGNFKKDNAEKIGGNLMIKEQVKLNKTKEQIKLLKEQLEADKEIYFKSSNAPDIKNKILLHIQNLSFAYEDKGILTNFNLLVRSKDRIAIEGCNGSGKTTLLNLITGKIIDYQGSIKVDRTKLVYLQQNHIFINPQLTLLEYMKNFTSLKELDCRNLLAMFLFKLEDALKEVGSLSGGEKIRFLLCCALAKPSVNLLILDEPTNNLDIDSIIVLEKILNQFKGAIILVSHDKLFKQNISIDFSITLDQASI